MPISTKLRNNTEEETWFKLWSKLKCKVQENRTNGVEKAPH